MGIEEAQACWELAQTDPDCVNKDAVSFSTRGICTCDTIPDCPIGTHGPPTINRFACTGGAPAEAPAPAPLCPDANRLQLGELIPERYGCDSACCHEHDACEAAATRREVFGGQVVTMLNSEDLS